MKARELEAEERRISNFIDFVGEGRGSRQLGLALEESERRANQFREELAGLSRSRDAVFRAPPLA